eukprot:COSAG02_NODE_9_length_59728_cov_36.104714_46_plen_51_part_00
MRFSPWLADSTCVLPELPQSDHTLNLVAEIGVCVRVRVRVRVRVYVSHAL